MYKNINDNIQEMLDMKNIIKFIPKTLKIVKGNTYVNESVFKSDSKIIFDKSSKNFHIFPDKKIICQNLSNEYSKVRNELKNKLLKMKDLLEIRGMKFFENTGSRPKSVYRGLYKFILIEYCNVHYTINFMRYTCNANKVGCTMRTIQFHKGKYVNKGIKGIDICYTETDRNNDCEINTAGNICYNPPVIFPNGNSSEEFEDIIVRFLDFIENADKIANDSNERVKREKDDFLNKLKEKYKILFASL